MKVFKVFSCIYPPILLFSQGPDHDRGVEEAGGEDWEADL